MNVDIVDKYCTDDNNPIKNLRLKLATFVVEEVIYQNVKKKVKKIIPRRCNRRRRKRGLKTGNFFKKDIFHI